MKVEFYRHNLNREDTEELTKIIDSIFITSGPAVREFEKKFSQYTGMREVVCVSSCTAALHLSLVALGIAQGDEIITSPMTFVATATAILHAGARPVFVDVEEESGLIDIKKIEQVINTRTKAVIPVHLYGTMAPMKELHKLASSHGLRIVEDSAHCIEGERDGVRPGYLGDTACVSFYATKNLTCGEGGAILTNNSKLADHLRILRNHGMSKDASSRYSGKYKHWDMEVLGYKYNLDDIRASLLLNQLKKLDRNLQRRESICKMYDEGFSSMSKITIPKIKGKSARHLYTILVEPDIRDEILWKIQDKGIGVAVNYRAVHTLHFFRNQFGFEPDDFPVAKSFGDRTISLPLYPNLKDREINYIIDVIGEIV